MMLLEPRLKRALLFSLILHGVLLTLLVSAVGVKESSPPAQALAMRIVDRAVLPVSSLTEASKPLPRREIAVPSPFSRRVEESTALGAASPGMATMSAAVSAPGAEKSGSERSSQPETRVLADGVREYRFALGREAQRFKEEYARRYSEIERQSRQGREGRVELALRAFPGVPPTVSLTKSSGHTVLDEQALEVIGRAVKVTAMPSSLRGLEFTMPLVMDFRHDDE